MANDLKKNPDESDPLSATAMFLRALDQQSEAKESEPAVKHEPGLPGVDEKRDAGQFGAHGAEKAEFTEIFGRPGAQQSAQEIGVPSRPVAGAAPPVQDVRAGAGAPGVSGPGEFTRIFVKDLPPASPKPIARNTDERQEAAPSPQARLKGFSTPGASDSASAENSFTQIFRPVTRSQSEPTQASELFAGPDPKRENAMGGDIPAGQRREPSAAPRDPSITSLIESLSSPRGSATSQRTPEPAPYRADPPASYQPIAKPAQPSQFDAGGVTSFIHRLSEPLPSPKVEAAPPPPVHEPNTEPGEFTRIISSPSRIDGSTPVAGSPAPETPAPLPEIAFARPSAPQVTPMSVQVSMPQAHVAMPQAHVAMPQAHLATPQAHVAMPQVHAAAQPSPAAPKIPAPQLSPMPPLAAAAAPKGKLESLVPMLLVVNTFLLVVILVVMIFLIKAR